MTSLLTDTICNNDNAVCASAPGKVILFGEHAVVYGEPALAAALSDLRIAVRVKPTFDDQMIRIQMPDLSHPIDFEIPMERVMSDLKDKLKIPPTPACAEAIEEILVGPSHSTTSRLSASESIPRSSGQTL
ncbi:mevalonate kinase [Mayamaea pseudoterrestris]|nr:mevalonate kinase [Mayamaea pseudoterrestris]